METLKGRIIQILTQKESDWGRYKLDCIGNEYIAVGTIPKVQVGMSVELEGIHENKGFGPQFTIKNVLSMEKDEFAGIRGYLSSGLIQGVGPVTASRIVEMFGKNTEKAFEKNGGADLLKVKGISKNKLPIIIDSYKETQEEKEIYIVLNGSATRNQVQKILDYYDNKEDGSKKKKKTKASQILKKNPYRLMYDIDGYGFLKTDVIALASGVKTDSVYRISAAIIYTLKQAANLNGHCYLTMEELQQGVIDLLVKYPSAEKASAEVVRNFAQKWKEKREDYIIKYDPSAEELEAMDECSGTMESIKDSMYDAMCASLKEEQIVNDDGNIYTKEMFDTESYAAETLVKMIKQHPVRFIKPEVVEMAIKEVEARKTEVLHKEGKDFDFIFMKEQRDAVYMSLMHRVSVISGGPGRGKTAISEAVALAFLMAAKDNRCVQDREDVIMLAPTGRAAQRMTESTGYPAMTIHRFVGKSDWGDQEPPENKLIICDESSMVDIYLLARLLRKGNKCNIVFVGDIDQIASVGPGRVLADLIASGKIPYVMLNESHRNEGSIEHNSKLINEGKTLSTYCYDDHFRYFPSTKENIREVIIKDYHECIRKYGIQNVMLLLAMKRGSLSVTDINKQLQKELTSGEYIEFGSSRFYVGDRVMQTRNNYNFQVLGPDKTFRRGVFNGERGTVARFVWREGVKYMDVYFDDGSWARYSKETGKDLVLAYATTVHKSQGSEAECVLMGYTYGDYILLNRNLFYTGETRAKKEFRFYGEERVKYRTPLSAFDIAVKRIDDSKRNTWLANRIRDGLKNQQNGAA